MGLTLKSFWKKPQAARAAAICKKDPWDLDAPLFALSPYDIFTWRKAFEQVAIFGEIGAAKSTGSGAHILLAYLRSGAGGLFNTVKAGDDEVLRFYLQCTGTQGKLIQVEPSQERDKPPRWRCNLLKYALAVAASRGSRVEMVVSTLITIVDAAERGEKSGNADRFWSRSVKKLLRNVVEILLAARGTVTMKLIHSAIMSAPRSPEQVHDEAWQKTSLLYQLLEEAETKQEERNAREQSDYELAATYMLQEYADMPHDTRGSVIATYSVLADVLLRGDMADLFDSDTNFTPELTFGGAIICLNLPAKAYGPAGTYAQAAFTYLWQIAVERRDTDANPRPVWWFLDEAAELVNDYTPRFLATARSKRMAAVLICQNLSNYFAAFGGESGRHQVEAILGNTGTKILHANGHSQTNEWASKMISDEIQVRYSFHAGEKGGGGGEQIGHKVLPAVFTMLRKGGAPHFTTDCIVYQTGAGFAANAGQPYLRAVFEQILPGR